MDCGDFDWVMVNVDGVICNFNFGREMVMN